MATILSAHNRKAAYQLILSTLRVLEDTPTPASCFTYKDATTLVAKLTDSLSPPFDTTQLLIVQSTTHEEMPHLLSITPTTNGGVICEINSTRVNEAQQQRANQLKQQLEAHFTRLNMPCRILQRVDSSLPTPSSTEDVSAYHTLRLFQIMLKQQYPAHPLNDFGHTLDELVAFSCACKQLTNPEQNYSVDSHNNLHTSNTPGCLINLPNPNHSGYLLQNHGVVTNAHCEFNPSTEQYSLTYHPKSNDTEDDLSLQAAANLLYHEKHKRFTGDITQLPINFWGLDETRAARLTQHLFAAGFALVNGQLNPNRTNPSPPQAAEAQTPDAHIRALETPTPEPATPIQPAPPEPHSSRAPETDALQADLEAAREDITHLSIQLETTTTALSEARHQHDLFSKANSRLRTNNSALESAASRATHRLEALEAAQQSRLTEIDELHERQRSLEATARKAGERASALHGRLSAAQTEISRLSTASNALKEQLAASTGETEALQQARTVLEARTDTLASQLALAQTAQRKVEGERDALHTEIDSLRRSHDTLEATAAEATERAAALTTQLATAREARAHLSSAHEALKEQLAASIGETEALQQAQVALEARTDTLASQLALAQTAQRKVEGERDALHSEIDSLRSNHHTLEATARKADERASALHGRLSAAQTEISRLSTASNALKEQLAASTGETEALQQAKAALEARTDTLASQLALAQTAQRKVEGERDVLHTEIDSLRRSHDTLEATAAEATKRAKTLTDKLRTALNKIESLSTELAHSTARAIAAESAATQAQEATDRSKAATEALRLTLNAKIVEMDRLESHLKSISLEIDRLKRKPDTQHAGSQAGTPSANLDAEKIKLTRALQTAQQRIKTLEQQLEAKADYIPLSHLEDEMQRTADANTAHATTRRENSALRLEIQTLRDAAQVSSRAATIAIQTNEAEIKRDAEAALRRAVESTQTEKVRALEGIQQQHKLEIEALEHKITLLEKPISYKSAATNTPLTETPESETSDKLKQALKLLNKKHSHLLKKFETIETDTALLSADYNALSTEHSAALAENRRLELRLQQAIESIDSLESALRESHTERPFKKPTPPGRPATTRRERDLARRHQTEKAALQKKLEALQAQLTTLQKRPETKPGITAEHASVSTQVETPASVETAMNTARPAYVDASTATPPRTQRETALSGTIHTLLAQSPASKHHNPNAQNVDHLLKLSPQDLVIYDSKLSTAIPLTQGLLMGLKVAFKEDGERGHHRNDIKKMMDAINDILISNKLINPKSTPTSHQPHFFKSKADTGLLKNQAHQLATALIQHTDVISESDVIKSALNKIKLPHKSYCPTIGDHLDDAIGYLMAFGHEPKTQALLASDLLAMTLHADTPQREQYRLHFSAEDVTEEMPALANPLTVTV